MYRIQLLVAILIFSFLNASEVTKNIKLQSPQKNIVYLVSDIKIPFWDVMNRGIIKSANELGYKVITLSANNNFKKELENTIDAINKNVAGIVVSPTNSSACVTILHLAKEAKIPVVISDIGTKEGEYVSYVSSNNLEGAYKLGKILVKKMKSLNLTNNTVGIVAIPQKRVNGQQRTKGFLKALDEEGIKTAGLKQQKTFTDEETYTFVKEFIADNKNLKAIWLQGSDRYQAALDAIKDSGKEDEILLIAFDAEPIFLDLIPKEILVGAAMQQPYLMGQKSIIVLDKHLKGVVSFAPKNLPTSVA